MAALAYLLPPVSGLAAYLLGSSPRMRRHGLQAVLLGVAWPALLYAGAAVSPGATQVVAGLEVAVWGAFIVGAAAGRDPRWPVLGEWFERLAAESPRERED
jgi:uncharacterized membrane protein